MVGYGDIIVAIGTVIVGIVITIVVTIAIVANAVSICFIFDWYMSDIWFASD